MLISRAVADPEFSDEILEVVAEQLKRRGLGAVILAARSPPTGLKRERSLQMLSRLMPARTFRS